MQTNWFDPLWKKVAASCIFFLLIKYFLTYIALSSFFTATIEARFDHPDVLDLYYASSGKTFQARNSARSSGFLQGVRKKRGLIST